MLDVGFSEILVIFVLALVVLGPEKLPRVASQVGRWIGRARAMARQFKDQLEEEVNLEQVRKAHAANPPTPPVVPAPETPSQITAENSAPAASSPDPSTFTADTFSHAHATDDYGANPLHPSGAAPEPAADPAPEPPSGAVGATESWAGETGAGDAATTDRVATGGAEEVPHTPGAEAPTPRAPAAHATPAAAPSAPAASPTIAPTSAPSAPLSPTPPTSSHERES
jgi:sec-independent protein translocase protein TatB